MPLYGDEIFTKINPLRCAIKERRYPVVNILAIILPGNLREYSPVYQKI